MKSRQEILTFCPICCGHCSAKATVEAGKIVKWEPDKESGLPSEPCPPFKGKACMEISSHPERLKYPQKRTGEKGEGKWEQISWDEALGTIAKRLNDLKERYGPECFAVALGEPKGLEFAFGQRLASAFGTPNVVTPAALCSGGEEPSAFVTFGLRYPYNNVGMPLDREQMPRLHIIWGANLIETRGGAHLREWLRSSLINGAKLVVIDPRKIDIAKRADMWIRPRPGSDGLLAMGLLKVVIEEKLYDQGFVDEWTLGFDALREHVKTFSLDDVERVTWVPQEQIEKVARLYAEYKPATIHQGMVWAHGVNSFQACRVVDILRVVTGPENVPAWEVSVRPAAYTRQSRLFLLREFPRVPERTHGGKLKWAMRSAYIPCQALIKGILTEKPYPIKAALFILTNPLCSYPNARETYEALTKLDLMVVSELFMTPTAAIADIVLPAATTGEHDTIGYWGEELAKGRGSLRAYPKLVDPPGEAWPDTKIINELAKRLGLGRHFWDDERDVLDDVLRPSGLTWLDFKKQRILKPREEYRKPQEHGFDTPSGKAEIYSAQAKDLFGYNHLPLWQELSHSPFEPSEEYPLLLTTGVEEAYKLTGFKHIAYMRKYKPEPIVRLNPETAKKANLVEGKWIYIETEKGRITQKLSLDPDLDPRVVFASFGWWFPENPSNLFDWDKSNINILFDSEPAEPSTGSLELRGVPCRVCRT